MLGQCALEITGFWRVIVVSMECRMRPILDLRDMPMLDWIEPAIIDMVLQVAFIVDEVLPVPPLSDAPLTSRYMNRTALLAFRDRFRKPDFDPAPADRKIGIAFG